MNNAKVQLRKTVRELQKSISANNISEWSGAIMRRLESMQAFAGADTVLIYHSFGAEVMTHSLIKKLCSRKKLLLPVCDGDELRLKRLEDYSMLEEGKYGIMEPSSDEYFANPEEIDLAVIPGIAFDRTGNRMGRGKGYYDRLLADLPDAMKIGICFGFQLFDKIPADSHDIGMDIIMTENEILDFISLF